MCQETIDRITTTIERMLRKQAVTVLIAKNETYSRTLDLACAIIYPNPAKQKLVIRNRWFQISPTGLGLGDFWSRFGVF